MCSGTAVPTKSARSAAPLNTSPGLLAKSAAGTGSAVGARGRAGRPRVESGGGGGVGRGHGRPEEGGEAGCALDPGPGPAREAGGRRGRRRRGVPADRHQGGRESGGHTSELQSRG